MIKTAFVDEKKHNSKMQYNIFGYGQQERIIKWDK